MIANDTDEGMNGLVLYDLQSEDFYIHSLNGDIRTKNPLKHGAIYDLIVTAYDQGLSSRTAEVIVTVSVVGDNSSIVTPTEVNRN